MGISDRLTGKHRGEREVLNWASQERERARFSLQARDAKGKPVAGVGIGVLGRQLTHANCKQR